MKEVQLTEYERDHVDMLNLRAEKVLLLEKLAQTEAQKLQDHMKDIQKAKEKAILDIKAWKEDMATKHDFNVQLMYVDIEKGIVTQREPPANGPAIDPRTIIPPEAS